MSGNGKVSLQVELTWEQMQRLAAYCQAHGQVVETVVEAAIATYVKPPETVEQMLRRVSID